MPSSKFNATPVPRRRPAICIAPKGSCAVPFDRRRPPDLAGYVHWVDMDPGKEAAAFTLIHTGLRDGGGNYLGEKTLHTCRVGVIIHDEYPTPNVIVQLWLFDAWRPPEYHTWGNIPMPLDEPFDTGLLQTTFISGSDFRIARFFS